MYADVHVLLCLIIRISSREQTNNQWLGHPTQDKGLPLGVSGVPHTTRQRTPLGCEWSPSSLALRSSYKQFSIIQEAVKGILSPVPNQRIQLVLHHDFSMFL